MPYEPNPGIAPPVAVPRPSASGWQVNWWGFVPLALVAVAAFVGFRALGLGDDDAAAVAAPTTTGAAATTVAPATTAAAPATTVAPTVAALAPTTPPPAAPTVPAGPRVVAWGEVKPCRFGESCLSVSFRVSGFPDPIPTAFRCVYPNSTRDFSFEGDGEVEACLTGDEGDVVYIEVAGVRSGPVSTANLNP